MTEGREIDRQKSEHSVRTTVHRSLGTCYEDWCVTGQSIQQNSLNINNTFKNNI